MGRRDPKVKPTLIVWGNHVGAMELRDRLLAVITGIPGTGVSTSQDVQIYFPALEIGGGDSGILLEYRHNRDSLISQHDVLNSLVVSLGNAVKICEPERFIQVTATTFGRDPCTYFWNSDMTFGRESVQKIIDFATRKLPDLKIRQTSERAGEVLTHHQKCSLHAEFLRHEGASIEGQRILAISNEAVFSVEADLFGMKYRDLMQ